MPDHRGWAEDRARFTAILLVALALRVAWRELLPIYGLFAVFAAVTALLWGHTSHRSVLDLYLMVLAAPALTEAGRCWDRRNKILKSND